MPTHDDLTRHVRLQIFQLIRSLHCINFDQVGDDFIASVWVKSQRFGIEFREEERIASFQNGLVLNDFVLNCNKWKWRRNKLTGLHQGQCCCVVRSCAHRARRCCHRIRRLPTANWIHQSIRFSNFVYYHRIVFLSTAHVLVFSKTPNSIHLQPNENGQYRWQVLAII